MRISDWSSDVCSSDLKLTDEDRARLEAEGSRPHWRFRLDHERMVEWTDLIRGPSHLDPKLTGDPVVRRADGSWLYMLPSVIDDIDLGINHVVRGGDHVPTYVIQQPVSEAPGRHPPALTHAELIPPQRGPVPKSRT